MDILGTTISPIGMGCWPIGGPFFDGDTPLGYSGADDAQSIRTIHAALDAGIQLFDTAAAYGTGHAERLLARALKDRPDALIVTKIGLAIDEEARQLKGPDTDPTNVPAAIDACLRRLDRDRIDILLLHAGEMAVEHALPILDRMEEARQTGKIRTYGWSTDLPDRAEAALRPGVNATQFAMNVVHDAPRMQAIAEANNLIALIRSPLAMGILTGKFDATTQMAADDVRATTRASRDFFENGRVNPAHLASLDAVRDLLQTGGRTLAQGALCWLLARSDRAVPIPGARTPDQIEETAAALQHGPLPPDTMAEIDRVLGR
ncbi:aldo/keto reductase [Aestuariibius sp. 2305UL40-4]|uniref:aldo/keto reductase n=1 Tax=Aestuariibius violaceus TaxID=3234132 RepID=UPI00345E5BC9